MGQMTILDSDEIVLRDGGIIDRRMISEFIPEYRYRPEELAKKLSCSLATISLLCARGKKSESQEVDDRHFVGVDPGIKYNDRQVASLFNVSPNLIYKLRYMGELQTVSLISSDRITGWSIMDFIRKNAGSPAATGFQFLSIGRCLRIPGWSVVDYIIKNCSRL